MTVAYTLNNIVYKYGDQTVLSLKHLEIGGKKTTALIGPNGSGKSTLLNLLAFLNNPAQGEIRFFMIERRCRCPAIVRMTYATITR